MNLWDAASGGFGAAFERQAGRYGDKPFLTWYDDRRGERVELSFRTFDNWVAKTANLLVDELGAEPGDRVGVLLVDHWQTPIVLAACWRAGVGVVVLDLRDAPGGLALTADLLGRATHDLGRALNFSRVVPAMGDLFEAGPDPAGQAMVADASPATMAELLERAAGLAAATGLTAADRMLSGRRLLTPDGAVAGLLAPFTAGAGVVLGRDLAPGRFWKRVADERVAVAVLDPDQAASVLAAGQPPAGLDRSRLRVVAGPGAGAAVAAGFEAAFGLPLLAD